MTAAVVAHQGGWDEILLVAGPIVVLGGLLWLANRRADRIADERADREDKTPRPGRPG